MPCWFWKELWNQRCRMVTFFNLSFTFFFEHFLQRTMDLMYRMVFFLNLIFTFFFKHLLQGIIGLRCSMVTFVISCLSHFTFFLNNFWKELGTSGVGLLHDSILSPLSFFEHCLQGIKDLKCRMVTFFNLISTFFFKHFLPGIIGLRCRMVTFFYLSFTFFFEHFLQGTMKHKLITSPQTHLTNSLQTACGHLTIFTSPHPSPICRVRGGSEGGTGWPTSYGLSPPPP